MTLQPIDVINAIGTSNLGTTYQNIKQGKNDKNISRRGSNSSVSSNSSQSLSFSDGSSFGDVWWDKSPNINADSSRSSVERKKDSHFIVGALEGIVQAFSSLKKAKKRSSTSTSVANLIDEATILSRLPRQEQKSDRRASIRDVDADSKAIQSEEFFNKVRESWTKECNW